MPSSNTEKKVIALIRQRGKVGRKKYKADMDRRDLKPSEWMQHHQEELCDAIQYAERLKSIAILIEFAEKILTPLANTTRSLRNTEIASLQQRSQQWIAKYNSQFSNIRQDTNHS